MQPSSNPVVIQFNDVFLGFMDDVVPSASGPHMFLSYLHQWYVYNELTLNCSNFL